MLDVRIPIGLLFTIVGFLLVGFGFWHPEKILVANTRPAFYLNLNAVWGLVMAAFGILMCGLAWKEGTPAALAHEATHGSAEGPSIEEQRKAENPDQSAPSDEQ